MLPRPPDVHDRAAEWAALASFARARGRGARLALVHGRRRQGKTFLLRHLVDELGGIYHVAFEEERRPALDRLGETLTRDVGAGRRRFADWHEAIRAIFAAASARPRLVVVDEFPYLLAHSPELPSIIQASIDDSRHRGGTPVRLVLCGSAVSVMSKLLAGAAPLRGRADVDLIVNPFDYRDAAAFYGYRSAYDTAFLVNATLGGTPGYLDLARQAVPRSRRDFATWVSRTVLSPSSPLFRELPHAVHDEPGLAHEGLYASVLDAIASGMTRPTQIATALERPVTALRHALLTLESTRLIARVEDVLRNRRPSYEIAEPAVRFHHAVIRPMWARFESGDTAAAWRDSRPRFEANVVGPHFERLAREWTARFAGPRVLGGKPLRVGPAVLNDRRQRAQLELDVVAVAEGSRILLIGEAKSSDRPVGLSEHQRLERAREILRERGDVDASRTKLALFGRSGFAPRLRELDVELMDLNRLYTGS